MHAENCCAFALDLQAGVIYNIGHHNYVVIQHITERIMLERIQNVNIQKETQRLIKDYIQEAGLRVGDPIPTEKEIAESIGISRTAVRESLKGLESLGLIEARHGVGRFVRRFDFNIFLESFELHIASDSQAFKDLFEIRRCLESHFIVYEMEKLEDQDIDELEKIIREMESLIENKQGSKALIEKHERFHSFLFRKSSNNLLIEFIRVFSTLHYKLISANPAYNEDLTEFLKSHKAVLEAIKTKDPTAVSKAVYSHFTAPAAWSKEE